MDGVNNIKTVFGTMVSSVYHPNLSWAGHRAHGNTCASTGEMASARTHAKATSAVSRRSQNIFQLII